jgi:transglutaminase/protease-like cytokinesis protein 3
VATVSNGVVTAVSPGTADITAASTDGSNVTSSARTVTVSPQPVGSITISPATVSLAVGGTVTLTPAILPANAANKTLNWSSTNNGVATVNNGVVTGVTAGTATIRATAQDSGGVQSNPCTVTVTAGSGMVITFTGFVDEEIDLDANGGPLSMSNYSQLIVNITGINAESVTNMAYTLDGGYLQGVMMGPPWTLSLSPYQFSFPGIHRLDVIMEIDRGSNSSVLYSKTLLFTVVQ